LYYKTIPEVNREAISNKTSHSISAKISITQSAGS